MVKAENNINFGGLLLLNELNNKAQFGLILKCCVSSLKWAQVEVNSSVHLGDKCFKSYLVLMVKAEKNISFGWLLLLNKLSD